MDLRAKLARLRPAPLEAPASDPPGTPARESPDQRIADLRVRMGELMARSRARTADERARATGAFEARLAASATPLPFTEADGPGGGVVHVRRVPYARSARVGWADLLSGTRVAGKDLAMLALDPGLGACDPTRALYLDTEATGLSGGTGTIAFLIGLAWYEEEHLVVEQLLLRRLGEEAPMLERLAAHLRKASMLVTFNGKSFDLPLLRTRAVMNRLPPLPEPPHCDLVHLARRIHRRREGRGPTLERWDDEGARRVSSCKLVALERTLLGFTREGDIEGGEVPARYSQFLRHGDVEAIVAVCDHNQWDVASMAALIGVYGDALDEVQGRADAAPTERPRLGGHDLVGLARTLGRAGALGLARKAADAAVREAGAGSDPELAIAAHRLRGGLRKKARDTEGAVEDFSHLSRAHDDPSARLELAKLLEHRLHAPHEALAVVERGTDEEPAAASHRRARLSRKAAAAGEQQTLAGAARKAKRPIKDGVT